MLITIHEKSCRGEGWITIARRSMPSRSASSGTPPQWGVAAGEGRGGGQRQGEGAGRRGVQAGLILAHTVSDDWKSETEDRAYCFGSEWLEILWLDVPRAVGPFQDRC